MEVVFFCDVTDFTINAVNGELITQGYQAPKAVKHIRATIFVCESVLAYGIGRMLQALHELTNPEHTVVVVDSKQAAEQAIKGMD